MTIYGQTLGVFKSKGNECIRNREKTNLHKMKNIAFISHIWCYDAYFVTNTSLRHNDVIHDEMRVTEPHMRNQKLQF